MEHRDDIPARSRARRILKVASVLIGALVLLIVIAATWLLATTSGMRFALDRARAFTHNALSVQQADGRLIGPLDLHGLRYADAEAGIDVTLRRVHLDHELGGLAWKRLRVRDLDVAGVDVALSSRPPSEPSTEPMSLRAPLDLLLDRVAVTDIRIAQDGEPLFIADRFDLAGAWTHDGIALKQLALTAPDGHAEAHGTLAIDPGYSGDGNADFSWQVGDMRFSGQLQARSDGQRATLELALTEPAAARLDFNVAQAADHDWQASLAVPDFDPRALTGSDALHALALTLQGHGNDRQATLGGTLELNGQHIRIDTLRGTASDDLGTLDIEELAVSSPDFQGRVGASGTLHLDAQPVSAELQLDWSDVQLPPELVGQPLASEGQLALEGNADAFHAAGELALGPPGQLSQLALDLDGSPRKIDIRTLSVKQPQGHLDVHGEVTLDPALAWQLEAEGKRFNPGAILAGWDGALDLDFASSGSDHDGTPEATLDLRHLGGTLRDRALRGSGQLHLSPTFVIDGQLELVAGASRVRIDGKPGAHNDLRANFGIDSLADWLSDASGSLAGNLALRGDWPALAVTADAHGQALEFAGQRVQSLELDVNLPDIQKPGGRARATLKGSEFGSLAFDSVELDADGTQDRHQATLALRGRRLSADMALNGSLQGNDWRGTLSRLDFEPRRMPGWHLRDAVAIQFIDNRVTMDELCLTAGDPLLCLQAQANDDGSLDARWQLHELPIALLATIGSTLPMRIDGNLDGDGTLTRTADGALAAKATLGSSEGSITWLDNPESPAFAWQALAINAGLDGNGARVEAHAGIGEGGRLDASGTLGADNQSITGQLDLMLADLGFAELFTGEIANVKGRLDASFALGGTIDAPALRGHATLDGFAAEIPGAGLKLHDGHIVASTTDASSLRLDGSVASGEGALTVGGDIGLGDSAPLHVTLRGQKLQAANIPAARAVVSPDLVIRRDADKLSLAGSVNIDRADIDLGKLPGAGGVQPSPDVVVVDRPAAEAENAAPIEANVTIALGENTRIKGFGLDGRLSGSLKVVQRPGHEPTGQGQITVDGTYRAYGQDLAIQRGQLLFASTPLDNPGLDIRATRNLRPNATIDEGQQVGLNITGTANHTVMTVFSNPMMPQSDALSYLVTGKPLSQVKGGEGNMVGAAAQALGSAAGDLLAKGIGARLGVEAGVSSNEALGGGAAFTVGKYLSPRLYLSYGVGLFDPGTVITLRYLLSSRWNFEAEQATEFSRASFNYRYEK